MTITLDIAPEGIVVVSGLRRRVVQWDAIAAMEVRQRIRGSEGRLHERLSPTLTRSLTAIDRSSLATAQAFVSICASKVGPLLPTLMSVSRR